MRTIIILILVYLVYRVIKGMLYRIPHTSGHPHAGGGQAGVGGADQEDMALDPVCGSYVPVSTALTADVKGERKYFCSRECRDKHLASFDK